MKYYMDKVIPPRPTFAADMTETESAIMSKHVAYWTVHHHLTRHAHGSPDLATNVSGQQYA